MNRIKYIFNLNSRIGINGRLKQLFDNKIELDKEEIKYITSKFQANDIHITHDYVWMLLLNSEKQYLLEDFCINGIERNIKKKYVEFINWDIDFYISKWGFQYLIYLFPKRLYEYFDKYFEQSLNSILKMSIAECVFSTNKNRGLELMIDILPLSNYDHETWDSIGLYVNHEGNDETVKYLRMKTETEFDVNLTNTYIEMINNIQRSIK